MYVMTAQTLPDIPHLQGSTIPPLHYTTLHYNTLHFTSLQWRDMRLEPDTREEEEADRNTKTSSHH